MGSKQIFAENIKLLKLELRHNRLYIFGAGNTCKTFFDRFPLKDKVEGIFDNSTEKKGDWIGTIQVKGAESLNDIDINESIFIITTFYCNEIKKQLIELGIPKKNIYHYNYLGFNEQDLVIHPKLDCTDIKKVVEVCNLLEDKESKMVIDKIVKCRNKEDVFWGYGYKYFPYITQEIIQCSEQEVFVDGGAFTGDTLGMFCKISDYRFRKVFAYEPDESNYERLFQDYGSNEKIICRNAGLWSKNTELRFASGNSTASAISECGGSVVKVKSIDEDIKDEVTFIKMDIEGAESEALMGAKNTIIKYRPKLAIAIYHKAEDLWEIPKLIKNLVPEYKLYVRHHSFALDDTVLYAVCD